MELNPYVIPVILLGVRYGTSAGLAAGLLSALWIAAASGRADLEDGSLVLPGLLVVLGTMTGALSRNQGRRLVFFRDLVRRLRKNAERARRTLSATAAVIRELQARIESEAVSAPALYRMSRGMGSEQPREVYESVLRILSGDLGVLRAAVYERRGDDFVLGPSLDRRTLPRPFAPTLSTKRGLAEPALRLGRVISIFDPESSAFDRSHPETGLLAGPIPAAGGARALVVVYDMELLNFSPETPARFTSILDWARESLARAGRRRPVRVSPQSPSSFDPDTGAYRLESFAEILKREENRARRSGLPYRVLEVQILDFQRVSPARRRAVRQRVSRALFAYTRDFDTIAATGEDAFAVLMPAFERADARVIVDRIKNAVDQTWTGENVQLSFRFLDPYDSSSQATEVQSRPEAQAA